MIKFKFSEDNQYHKEDSIYQVNNYTHVFETDLVEDDSKNINFLKELFKDDFRKAVIQIDDEFFREVVEFDLKKYAISYNIFTPDQNNFFFTVEPSTREQLLYCINLVYKVSVVNGISIVCIGGNSSIDFIKLKQNKIEKLLKRESWIPVCKLDENSGCAFIRFDGALLTIVENGRNFFEKYSTYSN